MSKNKDYIRLINNQKWRNLRNKKIQLNPLCEECGEQLATEVHHKIPIEYYSDKPDLMEELAYDINNLESVCHECHKMIHAKMLYSRNQKEAVKKNNEKKTKDFLKEFLDLEQE